MPERVPNEQVRIPATGGVAAPPPGAPMETAQPLAAETLAAQLATARANEKELQPLKFVQAAAPAAVPSPAASAAPVVSAPAGKFKAMQTIVAPAPPAQLIGANGRPIVPDVPTQSPDTITIDPILPHQKAASNSDSPSRGMPRGLSTDPGKQITGGFGDAGQAQYYPLDGQELAVLTRALMDKLDARITNDLRFSLAVTYPRVRVTLQLKIEGYGVAPQDVVYMTAHEKTPVDVAVEHADEMIFVVREQRQEFDAAGNPQDPPDRVRDELNLEKPGKRMIRAGAVQVMVDRDPQGGYGAPKLNTMREADAESAAVSQIDAMTQGGT